MKRLLLLLTTGCILFSCQEQSYLEYALEQADENRPELEKVLAHYSVNPADSLKLRAAEFLIENMPEHYSYESDDVLKYYEIGERILSSELTPHQQNDSILKISMEMFPSLGQHIIQDILIIKADYLIKNIDHAFDLWEKPWARHLEFDNFCEYLLPYKCVDLQQLDNWKDTLSTYFGDHLRAKVYNDENWESPFHASQLVRRSLQEKVVAITGHTPTYPFLNESTIHKLSYGWCSDYSILAVAAMRSLGVPVVMFSVPQWGRNRVGHDSYSLLSDRGVFMVSEWDFSTDPGGGAFFMNERIPKIYHHTYSINRERRDYRKNAKYKHPFDLFQKDATDEYLAADDLHVDLIRTGLKDKYVYIAAFNGKQLNWNILDFGILRKSRAEFKNMGRNMLYLAWGFDGEKLVPISYPFILHTNGRIEYIAADKSTTEQVSLRRKYGQTAHVVDMQRRVLNGRIQTANKPDFSDAVTLFSIDDLEYPDLIPVSSEAPYRYWRYLSPNGSWGSIAELQFFCGADTTGLAGTVISSLDPNDPDGVGKRAFDGDWFSNFETGTADGSWVGMDFGKAVMVDHVRCIPRNDDNYIHVGEEYELCYWDTDGWKSLGRRVADDNHLVYSDVPSGALLWLTNHTKGQDERVFTYENGKQVWW